MSEELPRPDINRILSYLNHKRDSILTESDIDFLEKCIDAIHQGLSAVLIIHDKEKESLKYMFSQADRVEAVDMMHRVILTQVKKGGAP